MAPGELDHERFGSELVQCGGRDRAVVAIGTVPGREPEPGEVSQRGKGSTERRYANLCLADVMEKPGANHLNVVR